MWSEMLTTFWGIIPTEFNKDSREFRTTTPSEMLATFGRIILTEFRGDPRVVLLPHRVPQLSKCNVKNINYFVSYINLSLTLITLSPSVMSITLSPTLILYR